MVLKHINCFGFIAHAHLDLAAKLIEGRERFDRVILDKKIESRERYMKNLPRLCKQVEQLSASITRQFCEVGRNASKKRPQKLRALQRMMTFLQRLYPLFYLKQKVTEEFVHLADDAHLFFFQAEDGIRNLTGTGVQTCALPIYRARVAGADDQPGPPAVRRSARGTRGADRAHQADRVGARWRGGRRQPGDRRGAGRVRRGEELPFPERGARGATRGRARDQRPPPRRSPGADLSIEDPPIEEVIRLAFARGVEEDG